MSLEQRSVARPPVLALILHRQFLELRRELAEKLHDPDVDIDRRKLGLHVLLNVEVAVELEA